MNNDTVESTIVRSREELDQPSPVARMFEPFTRVFLINAGLSAGMRVLDVCSGAGDLAFLARDIVGPDGEVTGFDSSTEGVSYANERADFRGYNNVRFIEAEIEKLPFTAKFDAVIGRWTLCFRSDPLGDIRALARHLRKGGLMAFQEFDHLTARSEPPSPVFDEVHRWALEAFRRGKSEIQMGSKLHRLFLEAGLLRPGMRLDGFIGGSESNAPVLTMNAVRMLLPQLGSLGFRVMEDVQVEALEEQVRLDLTKSGGIVQGSLLIGAWARLPS